MIFFLNIPMSLNMWNFAFNELCDLKILKKLISGSCCTPIILSYINNLKKYIYEHDLHKMYCGLHIFLLIYFAIYNYLLFFKVTTSDFSIILYTCVSIPTFFSLFSKIEKPKIPFWRGRVDVWVVHFYKIFGCIFFTLWFFLWAASKLLSGFLSVSFRTN